MVRQTVAHDLQNRLVFKQESRYGAFRPDQQVNLVEPWGERVRQIGVENFKPTGVSLVSLVNGQLDHPDALA